MLNINNNNTFSSIGDPIYRTLISNYWSRLLNYLEDIENYIEEIENQLLSVFPLFDENFRQITRNQLQTFVGLQYYRVILNDIENYEHKVYSLFHQKLQAAISLRRAIQDFITNLRRRFGVNHHPSTLLIKSNTQPRLPQEIIWTWRIYLYSKIQEHYHQFVKSEEVLFPKSEKVLVPEEDTIKFQIFIASAPYTPLPMAKSSSNRGLVVAQGISFESIQIRIESILVEKNISSINLSTFYDILIVIASLQYHITLCSPSIQQTKVILKAIKQIYKPPSIQQTSLPVVSNNISSSLHLTPDLLSTIKKTYEVLLFDDTTILPTVWSDQVTSSFEDLLRFPIPYSLDVLMEKIVELKLDIKSISPPTQQLHQYFFYPLLISQLEVLLIRLNNLANPFLPFKVSQVRTLLDKLFFSHIVNEQDRIAYIIKLARNDTIYKTHTRREFI